MNRRDWVILPLLVVGFAVLHLGIWYWGYTASSKPTLDAQHFGLTALLGLTVTVLWTAGMYRATLYTLRKHPQSRRLGWIWLAAILLPDLALALISRLGGPRFPGLFLTVPANGCLLGCSLAGYRWKQEQSPSQDQEPHSTS